VIDIHFIHEMKTSGAVLVQCITWRHHLA